MSSDRKDSAKAKTETDFGSITFKDKKLDSFLLQTKTSLMVCDHFLIRTDGGDACIFDLNSGKNWYPRSGMMSPMLIFPLDAHKYLVFGKDNKAAICSWLPTNDGNRPFTLTKEKDLKLPETVRGLNTIMTSHPYRNMYQLNGCIIAKVFPDKQHMAILTKRNTYYNQLGKDNYLYIFDIKTNELVLEHPLQYGDIGLDLIVLDKNALAILFNRDTAINLQMFHIDFDNKQMLASNELHMATGKDKLYIEAQLFLTPNQYLASWVNTTGQNGEIIYCHIPDEILKPTKQQAIEISAHPNRQAAIRPICTTISGEVFFRLEHPENTNELVIINKDSSSTTTKSFDESHIFPCVDQGVFVIDPNGTHFIGCLDAIPEYLAKKERKAEITVTNKEIGSNLPPPIIDLISGYDTDPQSTSSGTQLVAMSLFRKDTEIEKNKASPEASQEDKDKQKVNPDKPASNKTGHTP